MTVHARQDHTTTDPAERARALALAILDRAPRSCADLKARLVAKGVEAEVADALVARYVEVGLLDDTSLAATIARTRHLERGLAPRAIAQELRRKGFEEHDIHSALEPIDSDVQAGTIEHLARVRWDRLGSLDPEVKARRLAGFLGRKGYPPGLVFEVVRKLKAVEY